MQVTELTGDETPAFLREALQPEIGLQTPLWALLKSGTGWRPRRYLVREGKNEQLYCQVLERDLPLGVRVWYAHRGPVWNGEPLRKPLAALVDHLKSDLPTFLRVDPAISQAEVGQWFEELGFRHSFEELQPQHSVIVSLGESEEEILARMHSKGRYNIRVAERAGVTVKPAGLDELEIFTALLTETASRQGIGIHPPAYFRRMLQLLSEEERGELLIAWREGVPLAAIIVDYFGCYATYLHGASGSAGRKFMPNYLLQWEAIRRAKRRGCRYYDLRGIAPAGEPRHPYAGLRLFKSKFGGAELTYIGAYDLVGDEMKYRLYRAGRGLRRLGRIG